MVLDDASLKLSTAMSHCQWHVATQLASVQIQPVTGHTVAQYPRLKHLILATWLAQ